jgi:apolipoprotein D and lipocalin family protein
VLRPKSGPIVVLLLWVAGCATPHSLPIPTAEHVDLARYRGAWYVIGSIPTFLEKDAFGAIESYELNADGTIKTTFTFHKGSFDGPLKITHATGFVQDASHAVWGMRLLWPFKSEYLIAYLDPDYSQVIVARSARDHVWIMSRSPQMPDADYAALLRRVAAMGYDVSQVQRVPQAAERDAG